MSRRFFHFTMKLCTCFCRKCYLNLLCCLTCTQFRMSIRGNVNLVNTMNVQISTFLMMQKSSEVAVCYKMSDVISSTKKDINIIICSVARAWHASSQSLKSLYAQEVALLPNYHNVKSFAIKLTSSIVCSFVRKC